jgi:hypothetical protein
MTGTNDERRYSEEEFALILRTASEIKREEGGQTKSSAGLTLPEILQIAQEAGIDPELVSKAAALLPTEKARSSTLVRLFGGPSKYRMVRSAPGKVSEEDLGLILEVIRDVMEHQGVASEVFGGLEWKNDGGDVTSVAVNVSAREDETRFEVTVDRGGAGVLSYLSPFLPTAIAAGAIGGGLGLSSVPEVAAVILAGAGTVWLLGRAIFASGTRKWDALLPRLLDAMASRAAELAANGLNAADTPGLPGPGEEPEGSGG